MRQESKEEKEEKGKQRAGSRGEAEELQEWKSGVGREFRVGWGQRDQTELGYSGSSGQVSEGMIIDEGILLMRPRGERGKGKREREGE